MAATALIPERLVVAAVKDSVETFKSAWQSHRADLPISEQVAKEIDNHLATLPLFSPTSKSNTLLPAPRLE